MTPHKCVFPCVALRKKAMDFQIVFTTAAAPGAIYEALTQGISSWWTNQFQGSAMRVNDEFSVRFDGTAKRFKVTELTPDKKVVWTCLEAHIDYAGLKNKGEWVGTRMIWEIQPEGDRTGLTLIHEGLTRELECYEICEQGWQYFVLQSLQPLLAGKEAQPHRATEPQLKD
jgi:hypothetical protein